MVTFMPPTYVVPYGRGQNQEAGHPTYDVHRWLGGFNRSYVVLITDSTVSTYPGVKSLDTDDIEAANAGSGEGGKAYFRGGTTYTVTDAEAALLYAAGYTDELDGYFPS